MRLVQGANLDVDVQFNSTRGRCHSSDPSPMSASLYLPDPGPAQNRVDSGIVLGGFLAKGYQLVGDPAEADVIVVNTCAFIGPAKEESIDTILELGRYKDPAQGRCETFVVAGCLTSGTAASCSATCRRSTTSSAPSSLCSLPNPPGGHPGCRGR